MRLGFLLAGRRGEAWGFLPAHRKRRQVPFTRDSSIGVLAGWFDGG